MSKRNTNYPADLNGKVALITGGAKRIGACVAKTLHQQGMNIIIHYHRSADAARALQSEFNLLRQQSCVIIKGTLDQKEKLKPLIDNSIDQMGRLDVLVNNASAFFPTPLDQANEDNWDTLFNINLKAPFFLAQAAAPHLRENQGSIINLVDIYAERPLQDHPIYCATKAGLVSITHSLAQSLSPEVRVNGIAPGAILWPENQQDEVAQKRLLSRTPLKRLGDPQDIANTTLFLIQGAPYITGQVIRVDGGRSVMP